jgi:ComF family protein
MGCKTLLPLNDKRRCAIWLCESCEPLIQPLEETLPTEPAGKNFHFSSNRAAFLYDGILRDILRDIKFRGKKNHARALGRLWAAALNEGNNIGDTLVPVPLHPRKEKERGFNQAEVLSRELARGLNIPVENILRRVSDTIPQAGLNPAQRIENVAEAFRLSPGYIVKGKSYIMVDDIYTTGASLNECARTLMAGGARAVSCMTLSVTGERPDHKEEMP